MKSVYLLLLVFILTYPSFAQRNVSMKNLWTKPQVHVLFEGYIISFTIKDIDRALSLLAETGDTSYGLSCGLDTTKNYSVELYSGNHMEYHNMLQLLLQNGIGVFLLLSGHAYIESSKNKKVQEVTMNILPPTGNEPEVYVLFYDPDTGARIFTGKMTTAMYGKDMGID